jgi:anaerobic selenocysteine-containing dehydrogenase
MTAPASTPSHTVHRVCTICEATCGLTIEAAGRRVLSVRGDPDDPFSRGHVCAKARGMADVQHDPDRLRTPLRRVGDRFEPIGWDDAFALAAEGLRAAREAGGPDAIALYRGNPAVHDLGTTLYYSVLQRAVGTRNMFSAGSLDTWPRYVQVGSMFGGMLHIPVPDIDRTQHWLVVGANPVVSNGSLMTAPDVRGRIKALRARGGKLVVVDPRRSETADAADEHHFVRPGTDALFLIAMVATLFEEGLVDLGRVGAWVEGLDTVREQVAAITPERVAERCGIPAPEIRRMARELAAAPSAVAYGRMGTCCQPFGTLACWALDLLNILPGNLDRPGGAMFARAAAPLDFAFDQGGAGIRFGRHTSRVSGYDEIFGELPIAALAEEITTPGEGRVRALVTVSGNPVLSAPASDALDRALGALDFMVSIDFYLNETTRHADLVLPPAGPLESDTYDVGLYNLAVRNVAKWSPAVFEPDPAGRRVWEIVLELAKRLMGLDGLSLEQVDDFVLRQLAERAIPGSRFAGEVDAERATEALGKQTGPARILDLLLRVGPWGDGFGCEPGGLTLAGVRAHAHGLDLGPLEPALPGKLATASGRIELAPERILADLPRLEASLGVARPPELLLIGRRDARSMNSWLHNCASLATGRPRCTLHVHPEDAARLGLEDGGLARLETGAASVEVPVELSARLMPGVVSLPHGWGHDAPGTRLGVASRRPGVNANRLLAARDVDAPSGASMLNAVPVRLAPGSAG